MSIRYFTIKSNIYWYYLPWNRKIILLSIIAPLIKCLLCISILLLVRVIIIFMLFLILVLWLFLILLLHLFWVFLWYYWFLFVQFMFFQTKKFVNLIICLQVNLIAAKLILLIIRRIMLIYWIIFLFIPSFCMSWLKLYIIITILILPLRDSSKLPLFL